MKRAVLWCLCVLSACGSGGEILAELPRDSHTPRTSPTTIAACASGGVLALLAASGILYSKKDWKSKLQRSLPSPEVFHDDTFIAKEGLTPNPKGLEKNREVVSRLEPCLFV
eukprot:Gregarina_sp_Pseudo_9__3@NODE_1001_length_1984_cov_14_439075_g938_i0_p4_GENE_NODE_1001_length_1984_cov_14_439075_g938_i0NODE_1001_length_1984_cov_14_439075_g938_i0_p4_ORF_typecomplete_len112_score29_09_NODE_1001_length_1984_cov_14_439075_g938_i015541889